MFIVVMGVSGSGKTTIGQALARRLGWPFYDGDDYHPPENVIKMAAGIPLTDEDRAGWLGTLADLIQQGLSRDEHGVLACSALKHAYREVLCVVPEQVEFVYLRGSYELILKRMQNRSGHFMKAEMLKSQFASLEEPDGVPAVDITRNKAEIVEKIIQLLSPHI